MSKGVRRRSRLFRQYRRDRWRYADLLDGEIPPTTPVRMNTVTYLQMLHQDWPEYDTVQNRLDGHWVLIDDRSLEGRFYFVPAFDYCGPIRFVGGPLEPKVRHLPVWKRTVLLRHGPYVHVYTLHRMESPEGAIFYEYHHDPQAVDVVLPCAPGIN